MLELAVLIAGLMALLWYLSTLEFELGTGFTEEKRKAHEGAYRVIKHASKDSRALHDAPESAQDARQRKETPPPSL